ncbi:MAG: KH domain-containing protein [candidate division WOR-3 bacterium]|nr:MAG: KH domain-containing protein [candidate division WOR-3 bacterium]
MNELRELIEYIVKALVDNPEKVEVKEIAGEKSVIYELKVGEGDLGKVIGKEGRTAKAVRTIISAAAMKQGKRTVLEILE